MIIEKRPTNLVDINYYYLLQKTEKRIIIYLSSIILFGRQFYVEGRYLFIFF